MGCGVPEDRVRFREGVASGGSAGAEGLGEGHRHWQGNLVPTCGNMWHTRMRRTSVKFCGAANLGRSRLLAGRVHFRKRWRLISHSAEAPFKNISALECFCKQKLRGIACVHHTL